MIGLMLAILLFYLLQPSQSNLKKMVVGIIGIFLSIYFVFTFASTIAVRIVTPVHQEASAAFRFLAWYQSIQDFQGASIFGIGTGSFILETPFLILHWPHNLFLELACENGIFGLLLITVFVFFSFKWSYQNIHRYYKRQDSNKLQISISVFCIFIFALWNAMFSGDIATNPIVWYGAGLIYSMSEIHSHDNKR
ncbi:O-antigen ligase family protein [bacterium]|nr:O-antigen ligase family protein [bacterium]